MEKLAGADLDGDTYWVCWHPKFLEAFNPSSPAESKAKNVNVGLVNKLEEEKEEEVPWAWMSHQEQSIENYLKFL